MSTDGQGTKWYRNITENFSRLRGAQLVTDKLIYDVYLFPVAQPPSLSLSSGAWSHPETLENASIMFMMSICFVLAHY